MISVLLYSKKNDEMSEVLADQLDLLGFQVEQTSVISLPRLVLNSYQIIHYIVPTVNLSANEIFCLALAKALGKSVVISLLNAPKSELMQTFNWLHPDGLTVSQTNYLKFFRSKTANKMIVPVLFKPSVKKVAVTSANPVQGFMFPLQENLEEALALSLDKPVFFDGRKLLPQFTSSQLRKKWTEFVLLKKIPTFYQLILSVEKVKNLLSEQTLALLLASPLMCHSEFTAWIKISMKFHHLVVLNQYQATGFSGHWTSGHNCLVLSSGDWVSELNKTKDHALFSQRFALQQLDRTSMDALFNDLSRLYTKIIYQKTSLIDSNSAKI